MTQPADSIRLTELGDPVEVSLSEDVAATLAASGLVTVDRPPYSTTYVVGPARHVGVAVIAGIELLVKPKVSIDRLIFMLGYAQDPKGWRQGDVDVSAEHELLPAVAMAFLRQAERALLQGVLQGYRETEDSLPVLRGRLRVDEQLGRRYGLAVPLEVRFDEWTTDIAENRLLLAACRRLLRLPRVSPHVRQGLQRVTSRLAEVTPLSQGRDLPSWRATRLNVRYHSAVRLAELVLRAGSFEHRPGDLRVDGFMVSMASVFEAFVTTSLKEALEAGHGGRGRLQDAGHLDLAGLVAMRPDLVWYDDARQPVAVIDAKYKAEKLSGYPNADVYQLLAYCTALDLDVGHLVYARGNEPKQVHTLKGNGTVINQHALDLRQAPATLLDSVAQLADDIAGAPGALRGQVPRP